MATYVRFRVMLVGEAVKAGYLPDWHLKCANEWRGCILDFKDPDNPVLLGMDSGQPEDNSFHRDYQWVPEWLNALARREV